MLNERTRIDTFFLLSIILFGCSSDGGDGDGVGIDPEAPGQVTDLAADEVTTSAVTLSWTEVSDGDGGHADYLLRYGSPTVSNETEEIEVAGVDVGAEASLVVVGLQPATGYEFQVLGYRGAPLSEAEFGQPSNVVFVTTVALGGGNTGECEEPEAAWIWCDDFEVDRLGQYFEVDDGDGSLSRQPDVGLNGSIGIRGNYEEGQVNAGALRLAFGRTPDDYMDPVDEGTADYREIYWRVYFRNEADWQGGGGFKMSRATVFAGDNWEQAMIAHIWSGSEADNHDFLVADPASGTDSEGNLQTTQYNDFDNLRWLGSTQGPTPIFDSGHVGEWYCVEAHVRLNDAGEENGIFEFWIDGELEGRQDDVNWLGSYDEYGLNAVFLENYWNRGSPVEQTRFFDNFVVSTERIGCDA